MIIEVTENEPGSCADGGRVLLARAESVFGRGAEGATLEEPCVALCRLEIAGSPIWYTLRKAQQYFWKPLRSGSQRLHPCSARRANLKPLLKPDDVESATLACRRKKSSPATCPVQSRPGLRPRLIRPGAHCGSQS